MVETMPQSASTRRATPADREAIRQVAASVPLFDADDLAELACLMPGGRQNDPGSLWLVRTMGEDRAMAIAYCAPEKFTAHTWNLLLLAVGTEHRRQGHGAAMVHEAERHLAGLSGRMLVIDTASLPELDPARELYRHCGYSEEGRIRDFWSDGVDKISFRKRLASG